MFFYLMFRSHMDLYCPNSNCEEFGYTKYNDSLFELQKNHWFAYNYLFKDISDEQLRSSEWPTWSENSLVTPRISGLNLSDSIRSMRDAGIDVAVGDNSRLDLKVYLCRESCAKRAAVLFGRNYY
jgi:hypothetical protein